MTEVPEPKVPFIKQPIAADEMWAAIQQLVDEPVLWHISDPSSGVLIDLGQHQPLKRPVDNPTLSEEQRHFQGHKGVFFTCAWQLVGSAESIPLTPAASSYEKWNREMDLFLGARVSAVRFNRNLPGLQLEFDNGSGLRVEPSEHGYVSVRLGHNYYDMLSDRSFTLGRDLLQ